MAGRQFAGDVSHGCAASYLGNTSRLLQSALLVEDAVPAACDALHIHCATEGCEVGRSQNTPTSRWAGGCGVAQSVVRRRVFWTLDRLLLSRGSDRLRQYR